MLFDKIRNVSGIFFSCFVLTFSTFSYAQELEPRALTNVPVEFNFAVLGYGFAQGNILLDPAVPIEDLESQLHTIVGAYIRAINFFGRSGKLDVVVPLAFGDWTGLYLGEGASRKIDALGDPRIRLSVNFAGSPALRLNEYHNYKQNAVAGASVQIIAPLGQYDSSRLINLGSNRWTIRSQLGMAKSLNKWIIESYLGL